MIAELRPEQGFVVEAEDIKTGYQPPPNTQEYCCLFQEYFKGQLRWGLSKGLWAGQRTS